MSRRLHVWSPHLLAAAEVKLIAVSFRSKDANQVSYFQILPCNPRVRSEPLTFRTLRRAQCRVPPTTSQGREARHGRQRGSARGQMQKISTADLIRIRPIKIPALSGWGKSRRIGPYRGSQSLRPSSTVIHSTPNTSCGPMERRSSESVTSPDDRCLQPQLREHHFEVGNVTTDRKNLPVGSTHRRKLPGGKPGDILRLRGR